MTRLKRSRLVLSAVSSVWVVVASALSLPPASSTGETSGAVFLGLCRDRFDRWDSNHDGRLTVAEIDRSILSPSITGDEACALAALHGAKRRLTKSGVLTRATVESLANPGADRKRDLKLCVRLFNKARIKLSNRSSLLFAPGAPNLSSMRQGKIGDCYLISTIGALANCKPEAVRNLIQQNSDGTFTVSYFGEEPVNVSRPTDGELACYADAFADGIWLNVLERAYAQLKLSKKTGYSGRDADEEADDLYQDISGGRSAGVIKLVTGHPVRRVRFKKQGVEKRIRTTLKSAMEERRLVVASIHNRAEDGRKAGNHAVAVIGFDPAADRVHLWNPWGTTRVYRAVGLRMKNGCFSMPITDFLRRFRSICVEQR